MRAIPLYRFLQRYVRGVKAVTFTSLPGTMVLCTGMYGAADLSRQYITEGRNCKLDTTSASNMAIYGGFIGAPVYYHWYQKLDIYFARQTHLLTRVIVGRKLLLDMFLVTPVMTGVFYIIQSILERKPDVFADVKEKGLKTYLAGFIYWPFVQLVNFYQVPSPMRVAYLSVCSYVWCIALSYIKCRDVETTEADFPENVDIT